MTPRISRIYKNTAEIRETNSIHIAETKQKNRQSPILVFLLNSPGYNARRVGLVPLQNCFLGDCRIRSD